MRTFLAGIFALVLVVVPLVVFPWLLHKHPNVLPKSNDIGVILMPLFFSWLVGFIVAICGIRIKDGGSKPLHYIGKTLCVIAVSTPIYCFFAIFASCTRLHSTLN